MARGGTMTLKSPQEIAKMRVAGRVVAQALEAMRAYIRPGVTTAQVDAVGESVIRKAGATPSFKGLYGFPASVCVAVNDEVVHGIPGKRTLRNGDIIKVDTGAFLDGWHGDATITVPVGEIDEESRRLVETTYDALFAGIAQCRPGKRIGDIAHAIQQYGESREYGIVRQYVGHAIGRRIHEDPQVPNFGNPGTGTLLRKGMVLTIEPMLTIGTYETHTLADKWTVVTNDGKRAAQFEHTVAITDGDPEILTLP
ncbi:MAG: type I methionyl aminopeptidase [Chloroflexota bacterium]|nr:type I methionyl aminopeptidase [Chloroflexota bacterium]MDQ6905340.1 type I methionyl aminopeptidase [Chloroflexota bacterium]